MPTLKERVDADLKDAMRSKNELTTSVLRMLKSAIKYKEVEPGGKPLDDKGVLQVISTLIKQRRDSVEQFRAGGRPQLQGALPLSRGENGFLSRYPRAAPLQVLWLPSRGRRDRLRPALPRKELRRRGARPRPRGWRGPRSRRRSRLPSEAAAARGDGPRGGALQEPAVEPSREPSARVPPPARRHRRNRPSLRTGLGAPFVERADRRAAQSGHAGLGSLRGTGAKAPPGGRLLRCFSRPLDRSDPISGGANDRVRRPPFGRGSRTQVPKFTGIRVVQQERNALRDGSGAR